MDNRQTIEQLEDLLSNLTPSKESILKTTKFVMGNMSICQEMLKVILQKMRQVSFKRRLPMFYLIDSFTQNASRRNDNDCEKHVTVNLPEIVQIMVTNDDEEEKDNAIKAVKKVLRIWETRSIIKSDLAKECESIINMAKGITEDTVLAFSEFEELEEQKTKVESKKKSKGKRPLDAEEEKKLRIIEEWRQESKKMRWEKALRPENDTVFGEFEELWSRTGIKDLRTNIKDYDTRMKDFQGCLISSQQEERYFRDALTFMGCHFAASVPYSPVNAVSSPSPSPFLSSPSPATPGTPYSPSVSPPKSNPESLQGKSVEIYSPVQQRNRTPVKIEYPMSKHPNSHYDPSYYSSSYNRSSSRDHYRHSSPVSPKRRGGYRRPDPKPFSHPRHYNKY